MENTRLEVIWGVALLDEGFTSIPNLIIRNYRKLGIEHGEFAFLCQLISYKHDSRDPYPSQEQLAANMKCSDRQIRKYIKSLREKGYLRTGRRRNVQSKQWDNTVYNFKPLLDAVYRLMGETPLPNAQVEYEVIWDDEPAEPQVPMGTGPQVPMGTGPQVPTKRQGLKDNIKDDDDSASREKVNLEYYEKVKDQLTPEQFAVVLSRIPADKSISSYQNYLKTAVEKEINELKRKKETTAAQQVAAGKESKRRRTRQTVITKVNNIEIYQTPAETEAPSAELSAEVMALAVQLKNG